MKRFANKVCVVTASTQGIGLAIAERLAAEGGKVFVSSRKESSVAEAIAKLQGVATSPAHVAGCVCHVNKPEHRTKLFHEVTRVFGSTIDVLVLNAASSTHFGETIETPSKAFDAMFDTNVKSTFLLAQECRPYLTPSVFVPGGFSTNLLLVASIAGYAPSTPFGVYGITKTAMLGMTKALAVDLAKQGIRVNCLAPGVIRTAFSSLLVEAFEANVAAQTTPTEGAAPSSVAKDEDSLASHVPSNLSSCLMNRVGEVQEMGAVAAFLCSADASYVTGEVTVASGGMGSRL